MNLKSKILVVFLVSLFMLSVCNIKVFAASTDYAVKFSSDSAFTLKVKDGKKHWNGTLEYSTNNGSTWTTWDGTQISGNATTSIYMRGKDNSVITGSGNYAYWQFTGKYCNGNIENLLDYETVQSGGHPEMDADCFYYLFYNCTNLEQAPELPATTLSEGCYMTMFYGCTSLEQAPVLPATTLANCCYSGMFNKCTSLEQAPELPATILAPYCYDAMFLRCDSLEQAPELPATELAERCYYQMFYGCTSLAQAPQLPATTLAEECYFEMFYDSGIEQAPELPATTLADYCYKGMFMSCDRLRSGPSILPCLDLSELQGWNNEGSYSCYGEMFYGCVSLEQAPILPATKLSPYCYGEMFYDCISLERTPNLPATELAEHCYYKMFGMYGDGDDEAKLKQASNLPATILEENCYEGMFENCTSLEQAPDLPATILADCCYETMFYGCSSLKSVPRLPATTLAEGCYRQMFGNCESLEEVPELPATILADYCYASMFDGCESLKLSEIQEEGYPYEYNLGDLELGSGSLEYMFDNTGGTFTGTPEPNKTYYVNFKTVSATQTVEIPIDLPKLEKKDNIPNTSLDDVDKKSDCEVIANVYYAYYVSMPASLVLSPSENSNEFTCEYKVKAKTKSEGLAGKYIKIEPEEDTALVNVNDSSDTIELSIEQDKIYFGVDSNSQVEKVIANAWATIKGIVKTTTEKQGQYKGNFDFTYGLVDSL